MSAAGGKPKRKKPRRQHSLISEHYDGVVEKMKIRRKGVPDYYYELNAEQKEINNMIMESMNRKVNFLKNPRFEGLGSPILYSDEVVSSVKAKECPFRATPEVILFEDYEIGQIYSQKLTLVNVDKVLRRVKFVPPGSDEFTLIGVKYPSEETGDIAPGNSMIFELLFKANSLADYEDQLIIITEKNNFVIPLVAKREQPNLDLVPNIECNSCWIGKSSITEVKITNHGGHAGFWFSDPSSEYAIPEDFEDLQVFQSGEFEIYPDRFFLSKGDSVTLTVQFVPNSEGRSSSNLFLSCDNMKRYEYEIFAEANMIELLVTELDGVDLNDSEFKKMDMIYFLNNDFLGQQMRQLRIENLTKNRIEYEWRFKSGEELESFVINPVIGFFENRENKQFELMFRANDLVTQYEELDLIIKNIPLKSVKNPPPHIQALIDKRDKEKASGEDVDDNENVAFTYFTFKLMGHVKEIEYQVQPSVIYFPYKIPIKAEQTSVFRITNHSNAPGKFKILLTSKTDDRVRVRVKDVVKKVAQIHQSEKTDTHLTEKNFHKRGSVRSGRRRQRRKIVRKASRNNMNEQSSLAAASDQRKTADRKFRVNSKRKNKEKHQTTTLNNPLGKINNSSLMSSSLVGLEKEGQSQSRIAVSRLRDVAFDLVSLKNEEDEYNIDPLGELEIFIAYSCDYPIESQKLLYMVDYENAPSSSFQIIADFKGPQIKVCMPEINFGILQCWTEQVQTIEIENVSDVDAEVLLRRRGHSMFDFDMLKQAEEDDELNNIEYLFNNEKVRIYPLHLKIGKGEKQRIQVEFHAEGTESFADIIELLPKFGKTVMINVFAEVQEPIICLNRINLEYPTLYANKIYAVKSSMDPNAIVLRNLGNIPSKFEWIEPNHEEIIQSAVQPRSGLIEPKSEVHIKLKFVVKLFGMFKFYFKCKVDVLSMPLGFELTTHVFGLNIAYELPFKAQSSSLMRKKLLKKMKERGASTIFTAEGSPSASSKGSSKKQVANLERGKPFENLRLLNLKINEPHTLTFVLRNLSGLKSYFRLKFLEYDSNPTNESILATTSRETSFARSSNSSTYKNSFSRNFTITTDSVRQTKMTITNKRLKLLNDKIEKTHIFYSKNGKEATKKKRAKREAEAYLTNGKGVALVCRPREGVIRPNSSIEVIVMIFNELAGSFKDTLVSEVKGLEPQNFPVELYIKGSPLIIPSDQVGLNITELPYMLDFGGMLINTQPLTKTLRLDNIGTRELIVVMDIYSIDDLDENRNEFKLSITGPVPGTGREAEVKFEALEPEKVSEEPFSLDQQYVMIPPKSHVKLQVSYFSNTPTVFNSVVVLQPYFVNENYDDSFRFELDSMSVRLKGETFLPKIDLLKNPNLFGDILYKFEKWSYSSCPKQLKTILLMNNLPAHLFFKCTIQGPFTFLGSTSADQDISMQTLATQMKKNERRMIASQRTGKNLIKRELNHLDLQQKSSVGILVQFLGYDSEDYKNWPNSTMNFCEGMLKIHFKNGMMQDICLEGRLVRPELHLNTRGFEPCGADHTIDFGLVHTSDHLIKTVWLVNKSRVPAEWNVVYVPFKEKTYFGAETVTKLEKENVEKVDNQQVFSFNKSEGLNVGNQNDVLMVPKGSAFRTFKDITTMTEHEIEVEEDRKKLIPFELKIRFKPDLNILYKTRYRILVKGGRSIEFFLKGRGTYDEKYKKRI